MFWKKADNITIILSENPTLEFGIVTIQVGQNFPKGNDPQDGFNTVEKIEVSRWRKHFRIHYNDNSIVTYRHFRFIYGEKKRLN